MAPLMFCPLQCPEQQTFSHFSELTKKLFLKGNRQRKGPERSCHATDYSVQVGSKLVSMTSIKSCFLSRGLQCDAMARVDDKWRKGGREEITGFDFSNHNRWQGAAQSKKTELKAENRVQLFLRPKTAPRKNAQVTNRQVYSEMIFSSKYLVWNLETGRVLTSLIY